MKKRTHLIFAFLLFIVFNRGLGFPLLDSVFALLGALVPDMDLYPRSWHRKVLHNLWALGIIVMIGMAFNVMSQHIALLFSVGFVSHLIADSMTPQGIRWLWPLSKPHIRGPIRTGGFREHMTMIAMVFIIFVLFGIVSINL